MTKTFIQINANGAYDYGTYVQIAVGKDVLTTIGTRSDYQDARKALIDLGHNVPAVAHPILPARAA